ncbi:MAG TPA: DUF1893 domain-containing protein [Clostridia bacterium]|nr:DUF1893 domain-containing protein [Clostridia bacterium]
MSDQTLAQDRLLEGGYSCVLVRNGDIIMASRDKGIMPLFLKLTKDENSLQNASMADRVVGKALALLVLFAGIRSVYGYVMSDCAKLILNNNKVNVKYDKMVPYIMNKDGTDKCPMENLVDNIEAPQRAFDIISDFFRKESTEEIL